MYIYSLKEEVEVVNTPWGIHIPLSKFSNVEFHNCITMGGQLDEGFATAILSPDIPVHLYFYRNSYTEELTVKITKINSIDFYTDEQLLDQLNTRNRQLKPITKQHGKNIRLIDEIKLIIG